MARREDGPGPARPIEAVPPPTIEDPTWERLEDQLSWYDRKSRDNQRRYTWLKLLELAVAASRVRRSIRYRTTSAPWLDVLGIGCAVGDRVSVDTPARSELEAVTAGEVALVHAASNAAAATPSASRIDTVHVMTAQFLLELAAAVLGQRVEHQHGQADVDQRPDRVIRHPGHRGHGAKGRGDVPDPPSEL